MGRLIKNHLARLIVMSAAFCESSPSLIWYTTRLMTDSLFLFCRPVCWIYWRLFLAKGLLELPDAQSRRRSDTSTNFADTQPDNEPSGLCVGMATEAAGWHDATPQYWIAPGNISPQCAHLRAAVPGRRCCSLLSHRGGGLFLGLQRRRG